MRTEAALIDGVEPLLRQCTDRPFACQRRDMTHVIADCLLLPVAILGLGNGRLVHQARAHEQKLRFQILAHVFLDKLRSLDLRIRDDALVPRLSVDVPRTLR